MMSLNEYLAVSGATQAQLAREVGVSQSMVWQWLSGRRRVPAERCPIIERLTSGAVRCEVLRPDVDWSVLRGAAVDKEAA